MSKTLSFPRRLGHVAGMLAALAGRPVARWSPRPALPPLEVPRPVALSAEIRLWRLPVGVVRVRSRHRALPHGLSGVDDALRFPVMMSDSQITGWLDCTAWLIEHPERTILVDTGESADFGTAAYFGADGPGKGRIYPRIIDGTAAPGNTLANAIVWTGRGLDQIDLCVLTHTHSDHTGNLGDLARTTRLLVAAAELAPGPRSGRLTLRLPQDGRVVRTEPRQTHPILGPVEALTTRGDIMAVPLPGHTAGHQGVLIDLGARQVLIAGDAAFNDGQVAQGILPGIVEDGRAVHDTYHRMRRLADAKPLLRLFTHDPANAAKLTDWAP